MRIRCLEEAIPTRKDIEEVPLACDDDEEVAEAAGTVVAKGKSKDKDQAARAAEDAAITELRNAVGEAVDAVSCDPECPNKRVTVLLKLPVARCPADPDEDGFFECTAEGQWSVKIRCY